MATEAEDTRTATEKLTEAISELGLSITATFVPWTQSRSAQPSKTKGFEGKICTLRELLQGKAGLHGHDLSARNLNWKITLWRNGREVLTTDYSAGMAHCPGYGLFFGHRDAKRNGTGWVIEAIEALDYEVQTGKAYNPHLSVSGRAPINPDPISAIWSLTQDTDALNYASFEDYAESMGVDSDSRAEEKTYRACLDIALKMRAALGEDGLAKLQEAGREY